jgi:hypothetical protein
LSTSKKEEVVVCAVWSASEQHLSLLSAVRNAQTDTEATSVRRPYESHQSGAASEHQTATRAYFLLSCQSADFTSSLSPYNDTLKNMSMPLQMFAGTWKGRGQVLKRTGEVAATYTEVAVWELTRQTPAFVVYKLYQDTRHADTSKPMHTETGFLKIMKESGQATLNLAHPFPSGFVNEMSYGKLDGNMLTLEANDFQRAAPTNSDSKQVTGFKREYTLMGEKLVYDQYLASGGGELYHHLKCELTLEK